MTNIKELDPWFVRELLHEGPGGTLQSKEGTARDTRSKARTRGEEEKEEEELTGKELFQPPANVSEKLTETLGAKERERSLSYDDFPGIHASQSPPKGRERAVPLTRNKDSRRVSLTLGHITGDEAIAAVVSLTPPHQRQRRLPATIVEELEDGEIVEDDEQTDERHSSPSSPSSPPSTSSSSSSSSSPLPSSSSSHPLSPSFSSYSPSTSPLSSSSPSSSSSSSSPSSSSSSSSPSSSSTYSSSSSSSSSSTYS